MGNQFLRTRQNIQFFHRRRENFSASTVSSKIFKTRKLQITYLKNDVLFMLKEKQNYGANIVNVHICFVKVLHGVSFSGNMNFNINSIEGPFRSRSAVSVINSEIIKCVSIKSQFFRVKKYHSFEKIFFPLIFRLFQFYVCFSWVTLPTANAEIKYSKPLQPGFVSAIYPSDIERFLQSKFIII